MGTANAAAAGVSVLADELERLAKLDGRTIRITVQRDVNSASLDAALTDAAKRGQLPDFMNTVTKQVGR